MKLYELKERIDAIIAAGKVPRDAEVQMDWWDCENDSPAAAKVGSAQTAYDVDRSVSFPTIVIITKGEDIPT